VICNAVLGGLLAILVLLATHEPGVAGITGLLGFILSFVIGAAIAVRGVKRFLASFEARFPAPGTEPPAA
jgi:ascorbate-specific PTS system EIIC-type component UlaA